MRADGNFTGSLSKGLCALIGVSALLGACATEEPNDGTLPEGTYAIEGFDLGSCVEDTWVKSATNMVSLEVTFTGDSYVMNMCSEQGACAPTTPSRFAWSVDQWRGEDGSAYLTETGCLYQYVNATVHLDGDSLTIASDRWSSDVSGSSCSTQDAKFDLASAPCTSRSRLVAVQR